MRRIFFDLSRIVILNMLSPPFCMYSAWQCLYIQYRGKDLERQDGNKNRVERVERSMNITIDHEFNRLMERDLKLIIAQAFISLEAEMRLRKHGKQLSEREIRFVEKKASKMKQEISNFIYSQKQRIIAENEAPQRNPENNEVDSCSS